MPVATTTNTARPQALGYGAALNTLLLRLAAAPGREHTLESADLQAPPVNTGQVPEEFRSDFGADFARSEFNGGEGLRFAHRRNVEPRDVRRFFASKGVNVFPDDPDLDGITLLHDTAEIEDSASTNLHLAWDGTAVYMAEGTTTRRSTDFSTFADEDPHAGQAAVTVNDLTAFGEDVYAALGASGIHLRDGSAGTWSHWSDLAAVKVWALKTFILASTGNALYEAASGAGSTLLLTIGPGKTFQSACDAGAAILVTADDGLVYAIGDDGAAGLELKGQTFVGDEELPYGIAARDGVVGYATGQDNDNGGKIARAYVADLNVTSFTLENARRHRTWGDQASATDHVPRRVLMTRDSFWFGVDDGTTAQVWRYHLGHAGIARDIEAAVDGQIVDMLMIENRLLFSVSGEGLYREATTFVEDGWLMGPLGDLFTAESKPWVGALLDSKAIASDERIELYRATDPAALEDDTATAWSRIKNVKSSRDETETSMTSVEGRFMAGMVKLYANTANTSAPTVRGFSFRAYPPKPDQLLVVWVNVSDTATRPGYRPVKIKTLGKTMYDELKGKEGQYAQLTFYATDETFRGTVEKVRMALPEEQQRWSVPVARLAFRGQRASSFEGTNAAGALGVGTLGVMTLGGTDA